MQLAAWIRVTIIHPGSHHPSQEIVWHTGKCDDLGPYKIVPALDFVKLVLTSSINSAPSTQQVRPRNAYVFLYSDYYATSHCRGRP